LSENNRGKKNNLLEQDKNTIWEKMKRTVHLLNLFLLLSLSGFSQTKEFKWIPWSRVSPVIKNNMKTFIHDREVTLYDHIAEMLEQDCLVQVAVVDLNNDRKMGYAICFKGKFCCGVSGCSFELYEDKGKLRINITAQCETLKPVKGGVISSKGIFTPFGQGTSEKQ
jgi:hypothetical protein